MHELSLCDPSRIILSLDTGITDSLLSKPFDESELSISLNSLGKTE